MKNEAGEHEALLGSVLSKNRRIKFEEEGSLDEEVVNTFNMDLIPMNPLTKILKEAKKRMKELKDGDADNLNRSFIYEDPISNLKYEDVEKTNILHKYILKMIEVCLF